MARKSNVIKFDVSGQDPSESASNFAEPPQPGVYMVKIIEAKPGYPRNDEAREKPRLEIVAEVIKAKGDKKKHNGARLYDYIGFAENQLWKLDQFLQAMGLATAKKRKGSFDPDKLVGKTVKVRVSADSYEGQYQARLKSYLLTSDDGEEMDDDLDDDEDFDEDDLDEDFDDEEDDEEDFDEEDDDDDDDEDEDEDEDEDDDDDDDDELEYIEYPESLDELMELDNADLKALAEDLELEVPGRMTAKAKAALIQGIADELELEDDEEEEDEEDEETPLTTKELRAMDVDDLKALGKKYGLKRFPKAKPALVKAVAAAQDEFFEEDPFDED